MPVNLSTGPLAVLFTPAVFGALLALAVGLIWLAFAPGKAVRSVDDRLGDYVTRQEVQSPSDLDLPFHQRALIPFLRALVRMVGRLLPNKSAEQLRVLLTQAGNPGGLTVLDFTGVRLILGAVLGFAGFLVGGMAGDFGNRLLIGGGLGLAGYVLPVMVLRSKAGARRHGIQRALPDALDMLTIGVEAGLAFESALLKVCDQWHNPLTDELRRTVAEMRVGTPRDQAMRRLADRVQVQDLSTFVAVLVQSSQLGVSIADVLHVQAAQMRVKRKQLAEELARKATVKMIFPLLFFEFPALFIIILGPAALTLIEVFATVN